MPLSILSAPHDVILSRMPILFNLSTSIFDSPYVRCDAQININGVLTNYSDSLTQDNNHQFAFELSEYIRQYLKPVFSFPDIDIPYALCVNNFQSYSIIFKEYYGTPAVSSDAINSGVRYVLWGSIPDHIKSFFYRHWSSFFQWLNETNNCLSFWPSSRTLYSKSQTEKLFFCNYWFSSAENLHLKITVTFTDGTIVEWEPNKTAYITKKYSVTEFHVGYDALALDTFLSNHPGKTIAFYDVEIANATGVKSSKYTYTLNTGHYPQYHQFIFRNSLGGYDTFVATGKANIESSYEPEVIEILPWLTGVSNNQKVFSNKYSEVVTCNSGFLDRLTIEALPEMFLSDDAWEIIDDKLYPIYFNAQSILKKTDNNGMISVEFKYSYIPLNYIESSAV